MPLYGGLHLRTLGFGGRRRSRRRAFIVGAVHARRCRVYDGRWETTVVVTAATGVTPSVSRSPARMTIQSAAVSGRAGTATAELVLVFESIGTQGAFGGSDTADVALFVW